MTTALLEGRRGEVLATAGIAVVATGVVAVVDPHEGGHYPTCPFLAVTGWYCPFCGGLRAVHDLTHLDVAGAFDRNPVVVLLLPVVVWAWFRWARRTFTGRPAPLAFPRWWTAAWVGFFAVFLVLRNLPGWDWLSPA